MDSLNSPQLELNFQCDKLIKIESCRRGDSQAFYYKIDLDCSRIAQFAHAQYVAHGFFSPENDVKQKANFVKTMLQARIRPKVSDRLILWASNVSQGMAQEFRLAHNRPQELILCTKIKDIRQRLFHVRSSSTSRRLSIIANRQPCYVLGGGEFLIAVTICMPYFGACHMAT